jgi:hypothetical protein
MRRADRAAAPLVVRLIARNPVASSAQVLVSTPMRQQPRTKRNAGVGRGTDPSCCFAFDARWRAPGLKPWAETAGCSARHTLRCWRRSAVIPRIEGGGCAGGRKTGTHGILTGYSRGTHGVLKGYSRGTHGVLKGYSRGTQGGRRAEGGKAGHSEPSHAGQRSVGALPQRPSTSCRSCACLSPSCRASRLAAPCKRVRGIR